MFFIFFRILIFLASLRGGIFLVEFFLPETLPENRDFFVEVLIVVLIVVVTLLLSAFWLELVKRLENWWLWRSWNWLTEDYISRMVVQNFILKCLEGGPEPVFLGSFYMGSYTPTDERGRARFRSLVCAGLSSLSRLEVREGENGRREIVPRSIARPVII